MNATLHNLTGADLAVSDGTNTWTLAPGTHTVLLPACPSLTLTSTGSPPASVSAFPGVEITAGHGPGGQLDITASPASASDSHLFAAGFALAVTIRAPFLALRWFRRLTTPTASDS